MIQKVWKLWVQYLLFVLKWMVVVLVFVMPVMFVKLAVFELSNPKSKLSFPFLVSVIENKLKCNWKIIEIQWAKNNSLVSLRMGLHSHW